MKLFSQVAVISLILALTLLSFSAVMFSAQNHGILLFGKRNLQCRWLEDFKFMTWSDHANHKYIGNESPARSLTSSMFQAHHFEAVQSDITIEDAHMRDIMHRQPLAEAVQSTFEIAGCQHSRFGAADQHPV